MSVSRWNFADISINIFIALTLAALLFPIYKDKNIYKDISKNESKNMNYAAVGISYGFIIGWIISVVYLLKLPDTSSFSMDGIEYFVAIIYALPGAVAGLILALIIKYFRE